MRSTKYTPEYLKAEAFRLAATHTPRSRVRGLTWSIEIVDRAQARTAPDLIVRLWASWKDSATSWAHEPVSELL